MIQRIQSLYLLISSILGVVCLSLPLGYFTTVQGERFAYLYNLWIRQAATGQHEFYPWALFAILVIAPALTLMDILLFRQRALQMRVITLCIILLIGYYVWLAFIIFTGYGEALSFTPKITAALPFVCIVLDYLAFRNILKDDMLVRSLDRLR